MAVGTEATHPVSVLYAYAPLASASQSVMVNENEDRHCHDALLSDAESLGMGAAKPPHPPATIRRCITASQLSNMPQSDKAELDMELLGVSKATCVFESGLFPLIRSGGWADIGSRKQMEDTHVIVNDLASVGGGSGAYYGVFDGHSGKDAAVFVKENLLRYILQDASFPSVAKLAVKQAFLRADQAFAKACQDNELLCSGTTALAALILGRNLLVANAGDCRAVLCKRGKAIDVSRDHKACCTLERRRIEDSGGFVDKYGYLNGELTVARALGDWHITGLKEFGIEGPLTAVPEMHEVTLSEEDEFLIIACDGLWDVFSSQNAVDFARGQLQLHNDPQICSKELVKEALRRDTSDNLTVVVVCFQDVPPRRTPVISPVRRSISAEGLQSLSTALKQAVEGCIKNAV